MKRIVLLRHGESVWNREKRFSGWADIDLTEKGMQEAAIAGRLMGEKGFRFTQAFVSYMKRTNKTLNIVLDQMNLDWIPICKAWKLNGRHYGALQGLDRNKVIQKYGEDVVLTWRRSYDTPPLPMDPDDPRSPLLDMRYKYIDRSLLPLGESLKEASGRIIPYWTSEVMSSLMLNDELIVVSHGNALRGIVKHIKGISDNEIRKIVVPTATPYVFEYDDELNFLKDYYL